MFRAFCVCVFILAHLLALSCGYPQRGPVRSPIRSPARKPDLPFKSLFESPFSRALHRSRYAGFDAKKLTLKGNDECSNFCSSSNGPTIPLLRYREKELYKYKFEGLQAMYFPQSVTGVGAKYNYVGNFEIISEGQCSYLVRFVNLEILDHLGKRHADPNLTGYPARFSWQNGKMEKLCLDERDTDAAANLKRSILSNMQIVSLNNEYIDQSSDESTIYETDMYGECPVSIDSTQETETSWIIKKNKDLNSCVNRQGYDFSIGSNAYKSDDLLQMHPFVQANLESTLKLERGIVKSVDVHEKYVYQPLTSYAESEATFVVTTKINFIGKTKSAFALRSNKLTPSTLLFESPKSTVINTKESTIINALQEASTLEEPGIIRPGGGNEFSKFVSILQGAGKPALLTAYAQVKSGAGFSNGKTANNVFWDGLLSAATPATVETASTLLMNKEMPSDKIPRYLTSLAFVKHPTTDTLSSVASLLDDQDIPLERYLGVGSLIKKYLLDHPNVDDMANEVKQLYEKLRIVLQNTNSKVEGQQDLTIASLKALRNTQYLPDEISEVVRSIASNLRIVPRIRVAALQTLMVDSDSEVTKKTVLSILKNETEDSELRISSFQVYADAPNKETAEVIQNLLNSEKSYQVGGYIKSYITNIQRSTSPEKEAMRTYYNGIKLDRKQPFDIRQFSRNYEFSKLFSSLNLGYAAEADVIFSQASYIPRTTSLSLNSYIFGNTFNLFELGLRAEDLEKLIARFAGPQSYLTTNKVEDVADDFVDISRNIVQNVASEINTGYPATQYDDSTYKSTGGNMDIDLSVKIFDSEIKWYKLHSNPLFSLKQLEQSIYEKLAEAIQKAKKLDIDHVKFVRSPILSGNIVYYPTSSGLPIKLTTDITSAVSFKVNGNVDIPKMMRDPKTTDIAIRAMPSAELQVNGKLEIDAYVFTAGLKVSSSVRSATALDISFSLLNGRGVDLKIGVPIKEQDVFTMKTDAFQTLQERGVSAQEKLLDANGKRYQYGGSYDQLSDITGLSLFAEIDTPAFSIKPSLGPAKISLKIVKEDQDLKYYNLRAYYDDKEENLRSLEFFFDTPGSTIPRKISLYLENNKAENKLSAKFSSPIKNYYVEGVGLKTENEVSYRIKVVNDAAEYGINVGASITNEPYRRIYKPYLELKSPDNQRDQAISKMRINQKAFAQLISLDGTMEVEWNDTKTYGKLKYNDLALQTPFGKFSLDGRTIIEESFPLFDNSMVFTYGNRNSVGLDSYLKVDKSKGRHVTVDLALRPSQWPMYGFKYSLDFDDTVSSKTITTSSLVHGADLNSEINKIQIYHNLEFGKSPDTKEILDLRTNFKASYPLWKFNVEIDAEERVGYHYAKGLLDMDTVHLGLSSLLQTSNRSPGNIDLNINGMLNDKSLTVNVTRDLFENNKSKVNVELVTNTGTKITAEIDLTHVITPDNYSLSAESVVTLSKNKFFKHAMGLTYNSEEKSFRFVHYPNGTKAFEISGSYTDDKIQKKWNAVLYTKNVIDGTLQSKFDNSQITGELNLNLLKLKRLITGKVDFQITDGSNVTGSGELLWDASADKSKRLSLVTNTVISSVNKLGFTSKNAVRYVDYEFNCEGSAYATPKLLYGPYTAAVQIDLPSGEKYGIVANRSVPDVTSDEFELQLYRTGDPIRFVAKYGERYADTWSSVNGELILQKASYSSSVSAGVRFQKSPIDDANTFTATANLKSELLSEELKLLLVSNYSSLVKEHGLFSNEVPIPTSYKLDAYYGEKYKFVVEGNARSNRFDNDLKYRFPLKGNYADGRWVTSNTFDAVAHQYLKINTNNKYTWDENKTLSFNSNFDLTPKNGNFSMEWESQSLSKRSLDVNYGYGSERTDGSSGPFVEGSANLTFENKVVSCAVVAQYSKDLRTKLFTVYGDSPRSGKFALVANSITSRDEKSFKNDVEFTANNSRWFASSQIDIYSTKPLLNVSYSSPEGDSKFLLKFDQKASDHWKGVADIDWVHGTYGYIKANGEAKLDTTDDLTARAYLDAPKFEINNVTVIASNKEINEGKNKMAFTVKMADQTLYTGSVMYIYQRTDQALSLEGAGMIKSQNRSFPVNFKYTRLALTEEINSEEGMSHKFYLSMDSKKRALDVEAKFTNKGILLKRDLWNGDKCYKLDLSYKVEHTDALNYEQEIISHIDLKPYVENGEEFVIEGKTTKNMRDYNQRLSLQWNADSKIEYNLYRNVGKTGVVFTLPKRQLAAEAVYSYKFDLADGNLKTTGTVWFDKKGNENQKLMTTLNAEYKIPEEMSNLVMRSHAGVQIPSLEKELAVSSDLMLTPYNNKILEFNTNLDIFKKPEQSILVSYQAIRQKYDGGYEIRDVVTLTSQGQHLNAELNRSMILFLDHIEYHVRWSYLNYKNENKASKFDLEIGILIMGAALQLYDTYNISGRGQLSFGSNYIEVKEDINVLGHEYMTLCKLTTDPNLVMFMQWKGKVKQIVQLNASLILKEYANVEMKLLSGDETRDVLRSTLFLDDANFMKTKSELALNNLKVVLDNGKLDLLMLVVDAKTAYKTIANNVKEQLVFRINQYQNASIDAKPIAEGASAYLSTVRDEIKNDKSIRSASRNVQKLVHSVTDFVLVIMEEVSAFLGDWIYGYNALMTKLLEFMKNIIPNLTDLIQIYMDIIELWAREMIEKLHESLKNLVEYVKANQERWKEMIISFINTAKESVQLAYDTFLQFRNDMKELYEKLKDYVNSLPLTAFLKEKFEQFKKSQIPKYIWSAVTEIGQSLKASVSNQEVKNLIDAILSTSEKILNQQPYELNEEMKIILQRVKDLLKNLVSMVQQSDYVKDMSSFKDVRDYIMPKLTWSSLKNIPNILNTLTGINWLRSPDFSPFRDTINTYKLNSYNPLAWLPPYRQTGILVNGIHVVTFNGNQYSFHGKNEYILVSSPDFKISVDVQQDRIQSFILRTQSKMLSLSTNLMLQVDGKSTNFPYQSNDMYALHHGRYISVHLGDSVHITSNLGLDIIAVQVSGFYFNKVNGLLGIIGSEKANDFMLQNGQIENDIESFVNTYGNGNTDRHAKLITRSTESFDQCNRLFDSSALRSSYTPISSEPFLSMCENSINSALSSEQQLEAVCNSVKAYSLASYTQGYYLSLPVECGTCSFNEKTVKQGSSSSIIIPKNSADIIVLLEKVTENKVAYDELLTKSVESVRSSLSSQKINDVNIITIGYGPDDKFPALYSNGPTYRSSSIAPAKFVNFEEQRTDLGKWIKNIRYLLGIDGARAALRMALDFPYKPDAVKAIIDVRGNNEHSSSYRIIKHVLDSILSWKLRSRGIPVFLIEPKCFGEYENKTLFGFDYTSGYFSDETLPMEYNLLKHINVKELYNSSAILPLATRGALFSSTTFNNGQSEARNKYTDIFTKRIVQGLTGYEQFVECTYASCGIYAEPRCYISKMRAV